MSDVSVLVAAVLLPAAIGLCFGCWAIRRRRLDRWLGPYIRRSRRRHPPDPGQPVHLLLCVADHFEPHNGGVSDATARDRVGRWVSDYPRLFGGFRDSDGRPPRHTFFYPLEQYDAGEVDSLAGLCRQGFGEVEVHLHHDRDTADNLRTTLTAYKELLAARHGLLARDRATGDLAYAFVHGDWALGNSRPDGRCCGVDNELEVLRQTGCYADATMPSAPDVTQTSKINSVYYARAREGHRDGPDVGAGPPPADGLMLIQGPLLLDWRRRKWGVCPRIENGCLQSTQPPDVRRLPVWLRARVQVPQRPDWFFVKLHTHGASADGLPVLLGESAVRFHANLARYAREHPGFKYHYVTVREMYNLAKAAESGWNGSIESARDFALDWVGESVRSPALRQENVEPVAELAQVGQVDRAVVVRV
jgi:hypothetical protein